MDDADGRYVEFCKSTFAQDLNLKGLKIVVDSAHGAAYQTAPKVFHELGAEVINIGNKPDGLNINHEVGATHPETLVRAVLANHADYGIALDGDADRLQVVDSTGRLYNGDEVLYAMVAERLAQGIAVAGAVGTLMSNMAVEVALKKRGVQFVRAKVGDRYVLEELQKNGWQLGGESSGHLLALDKHSTGDGTIAALQVLQAVRRTGQSLAQLLAGVVLYPQTMINVRLRPDTPDWKSNAALQAKQAQISADLGDRGRVLIRASGTEPLLRVMVEADDASLAAQYAQELADAVLAL
jgi:phosphoglucosamine mutase